MKILGRTIRLRERFKGFWSRGTSTLPKRTKFTLGEKTWTARCKYFDKIYNEHPLAKAQILTIAGQLMAEGVFTECAVNREGEEYQRAKEAQERCDRLNEDIGLDTMLYETAVNMAKYGSCFWELSFSPKFDVRIIPMQDAIEPSEEDELGDIVGWRQRGWGGQEIASWSGDEIVHFAWNVTSASWPYGTSLLIGLDTEFEILEKLEADIKEHMEKTAFPNEIIQVGDKDYVPTDAENKAIGRDVKKWRAGDRFVTSYPINRIAAGTGGNTISDLHEVLDFLKDQCIDGLMVPPISKQWSSTMASAKEMMPWARANLIAPMQRIIRRKIEHDVYQPFLEDTGYSVRVTPKLKWESPDAHKDEEAEYWALQVQSGIVPAEYAAQEQGFDVDKIKQMKEEAAQRREEAFKQQEEKPFPISPKQAARQKAFQKEEEMVKRAFGVKEYLKLAKDKSE